MLFHINYHTAENTMIAAAKSLLHTPSRISDFALVAAFSLAGLVLSIAFACYGMNFTALL